MEIQLTNNCLIELLLGKHSCACFAFLLRISARVGCLSRLVLGTPASVISPDKVPPPSRLLASNLGTTRSLSEVIADPENLTKRLKMAVPRFQTAAVVASTRASTSEVVIKDDHPVPIPGDGEILVKLEFSGVCHSDLHSIRGDTPMLTDVAGHEGVGSVVQGAVDLCAASWTHILTKDLDLLR